MSVKIIDVIYQLPRFATLTQTQKVVVQYLANRANNSSFCAWPNRATIARECGIHVRSVQRAYRALLDADLIRIEQGGHGQFSTNAASFAHLIGKEAQAAPAKTATGRRISRGSNLLNDSVPRETKCHPCAGSKGDKSYTPRETNHTPKGDKSFLTYKEEPRKNQEEEPEVADATARTTTASATATVCDSPRKSSPTKSSPSPTSSSAISPHAISHSDLDMAALCEVTGILFGVSGKMNDEKLRQTLLALRQKPSSPHSPPATPENIRRFGQLWRALGKTRPYPSQVFQFWDDTLCPPNAHEREVPVQRGEAVSASVAPRNSAPRYESAGGRRNRAHEQHMAKLAQSERELLEQLGVDSLDEAFALVG